MATSEQHSLIDAVTRATSAGALAAQFLPRARALVDRLGAKWPSSFEEATRRHLESISA